MTQDIEDLYWDNQDNDLIEIEDILNEITPIIKSYGDIKFDVIEDKWFRHYLIVYENEYLHPMEVIKILNSSSIELRFEFSSKYEHCLLFEICEP